MKKEFIFNTKEENVYGADAVITAGRVLNTASILQGMIFNTIIANDANLTNVGVCAMSNTPILYKNLHGMDIDTSILDGYTLFEQGKASAINMDASEEVETSFMVALEFTTIPYAKIPEGQPEPEGYVKDDSIGLSLRVALPNGVIAYCKQKNINHVAIYMQIAAKAAEIMSKEFMGRLINTESSTVIGVGSEEQIF